MLIRYRAAHCNMLQHTATHCNTLQYTATYCKHAANTLQHTAIHCNIQTMPKRHRATHCNALQHTATHCNTLQHTATHKHKHQTYKQCEKGNELTFENRHLSPPRVSVFKRVAYSHEAQHMQYTRCNTHCNTALHVLIDVCVASLHVLHI